MTTLTEAAIMAMAEDAGIITGENLRRDGPGGSYMLMRSVGEAVNVRSDHLISLVRSALAASEVQAEPVALTWDQESRGMFVARLENMQRNGDQWLTVPAVLALLNDCDYLALRDPPAPEQPAQGTTDERATFEAWCTKRWGGDRGDSFLREEGGAYAGEYINGRVEFAYSAWQARAALASAPRVPQGWRIERLSDGSIALHANDIGACIVGPAETEPRVIPTQMLHALAQALTAPQPEGDTP